MYSHALKLAAALIGLALAGCAGPQAASLVPNSNTGTLNAITSGLSAQSFAHRSVQAQDVPTPAPTQLPGQSGRPGLPYRTSRQ